MPSGLDVTVYLVMAAPPLLAGATQRTIAWVFVRSAITLVGVSGTVAGVLAADAVDGTDVPAALMATAVKGYAVPLVKSVTTHDNGPEVHVQLRPSGDEVTV